MSGPAPVSPKGEYNIHVARDRQYNSKVKGLLYGGDDRPITPQHQGKKSVAHGSVQQAPFATVNELPESKANVTPKLGKGKEVQGKVNAAGFNSDVYKAQLEANYINMQQSKARNYTGSGIFGGP